MGIIDVKGLSFTYSLGKTQVLQNVDLSIAPGAFVLICGHSGCGKSTLLRLLKPEISPAGKREGEIFFEGKELNELNAKQTAVEIGFVTQNPEAQVVTDKVWHELAFGLENIGMPSDEIRLRVAEMTSYFGIHKWFKQKTAELSGGQKQLLNLASVMLMKPKVLLLDEPTSQLDPIASKEFLDMVFHINQEFGTAIVMAEHNLEESFKMATDVVLLEAGKKVFDLPPRQMAKCLYQTGNRLYDALPAASRLSCEVLPAEPLPITVMEGRGWMETTFKGKTVYATAFADPPARAGEPMLEMREVWFRYDKKSEPVLKNLTFSVYKNEIYCIMGANGAGKTTALSVISGFLKPMEGKTLIAGKEIKTYRGSELFFHNLGFLPQEPQSLFGCETLREDLKEALWDQEMAPSDLKAALEEVSKKLSIEELMGKHPYDLSGGEMQRAALAKILLRKPKILLLDEPTKGLDALLKRQLVLLLRELQRDGMTILMVSHDIEFTALAADRCGLFFDGEMVFQSPVRTFFSKNQFYTTAINRLVRPWQEDVITFEEGVRLCKEGF